MANFSAQQFIRNSVDESEYLSYLFSSPVFVEAGTTMDGTEGEDILIAKRSDHAEVEDKYFFEEFYYNQFDSSRSIFIRGMGSDDILYYQGDFSRISGEDGSDVAAVEGNSNFILGNNGNDKLGLFGNYNYATGNNGNDFIEVYGNSNIFYGGFGNDEALIWGDFNNTYGNLGNDRATVKGDKNVINLGPGNDTTTVIGDGNYINDDYGNDIFIISGESNFFIGKRLFNIKQILYAEKNPKENEHITLLGNKNSILGGFGNETINVVGDENFIEGYFGNDIITVVGNKNSIHGYCSDRCISDREAVAYSSLQRYSTVDVTGDDNTIFAGVNIVNGDRNKISAHYSPDSKIGTVNGNDNTIRGYVDIVNGNNNIITSNIDIVNGNNNDIQLKVYSEKVTIIGDMNTILGDSNNSERYYSYKDTYKDYYKNYGREGITIIGDGNYVNGSYNQDEVSINGNTNTVEGGNENDLLYINGSENTVNGDNGNDLVSIFGENNTVKGGNGDDTITAEVGSNGNTFSGGNGNDTYILQQFDDQDLITTIDVINDLGAAGETETVDLSAYASSDFNFNLEGDILSLRNAEDGVDIINFSEDDFSLVFSDVTVDSTNIDDFLPAEPPTFEESLEHAISSFLGVDELDLEITTPGVIEFTITDNGLSSTGSLDISGFLGLFST